MRKIIKKSVKGEEKKRMSKMAVKRNVRREEGRKKEKEK